MSLLVTSATCVNGNGYGALLAFDRDGRPLGPFSKDSRIADPRGLGVDQKQRLLFANSGADRALALDRGGKVVRNTGSIEDLNPAAVISGRTAGTLSDCAARARSWRIRSRWARPANMCSPTSCHFRAASHLAPTAGCFSLR